jgi:NADH-quinone oxidoreductase subunit N
MMGFMDQAYLLAPELVVFITAVLALFGDLFLRKKFNSVANNIAMFGVLVAAIVSFMSLDSNQSTYLFHNLFLADNLAFLMKFFISITVFLSFFYGQKYIAIFKISNGDFYVLSLFATLGMFALVSASSMVTIYLGVELLSLPLYGLTGIRTSDGNASEAAMKYIVTGAVASCILLYGMSLVYGATGQLNLLEIQHAIVSNSLQNSGLLIFGLVFVIAGLGFKLAAVPFHMYLPDVYAGGPAAVVVFLSAAPKVAGVAMALRLLNLSFVDLTAHWQQLLLILSLLSAGFGNLFAIAQVDLRRMFAYSAIAHMGYVIFGLLVGNNAGYTAAIYYIVIYALMAVAALGFVALLADSNKELITLDDLRGLAKRNPLLSAMLMIVLLSMAGVPPTVGFLTKFTILKALMDANFLIVAILAIVFAVIGAFYYLRVIKLMYFDEAQVSTPIPVSKGALVLFSINSLALLYYGILPSSLINTCANVFS